jgi:hypothetical protein
MLPAGPSGCLRNGPFSGPFWPLGLSTAHTRVQRQRANETRLASAAALELAARRAAAALQADLPASASLVSTPAASQERAEAGRSRRRAGEPRRGDSSSRPSASALCAPVPLPAVACVGCALRCACCSALIGYCYALIGCYIYSLT